MRSEQSILQLSIAVTILVAGFGVVFGLLSGSFSIVFDGVYMLADAAMSGLALLVSRLIALSALPEQPRGKLRDRFTMGFWHLEPMVLGLNGMMLTGVAIYALINAVGSLMDGGRDLEFSYAIFYAVVALIACLGMALLETRANRTLKSDFVALDAKAWIMSGGITAALLIAFSVGYVIDGTELGWLTPYIDPAVLAVVCLVIIPMPIGTIRQALADIFLVTPLDLKSTSMPLRNSSSGSTAFSHTALMSPRSAAASRSNSISSFRPIFRPESLRNGMHCVMKSAMRSGAKGRTGG